MPTHIPWNKKRPYESLYNHFCAAAKIARHPVDLTFEEFVEFTKISACSYCERPVTWAAHNITFRGKRNSAYNLDRLDNAKGYEKSNLVVCCGVCNNGRADRFTPEEWKVMVHALLEFRRYGVLL